MKDRFFTGLDWAAFWTATVLSFGVYALTLGPSVGLEDSGELATAAANLGVPHPPGYPFWTFCSWLFCKLFGWVTYMGHPTPAWCVSLCSAMFGAFAAGFTAMLICRSGRDFVEREGFRGLGGVLAFGGGVAGALTFALSPVEWSQSTIVEIYSLNAFFLMLVFLLSYRWMAKPSDKILWATAFVFGLGLTNYQVLLFAIVPLALVIALRKLPLFRDFMLYLLPVLMTIQVLQIGESQRAEYGMSKDVIEKHLPIGISEKEYSETLAIDTNFRDFFKCVVRPGVWRREMRALDKGIRDMVKGNRIREAQELAGEYRCLEAIEKCAQNLTPSVREDLAAGHRHTLVARTNRSPNAWVLTVAIVGFLGSLLAGLYFKRRGRIDQTERVVLFGGLGSVGVFMLLGSLFSSEATWSGARLEEAPLAEPIVYLLLSGLVALSGLFAVLSALKSEDFPWRDERGRKYLIAAGVSALLAVVLVFVLVPKAGSVAILDGMLDYSGPKYPWAKSAGVFFLLFAALLGIAVTVKKGRGLIYAIPVVTFQLILFLLLSRGAMNGLVHPSSWWFWWPLVWNFFGLVLAWYLLPHGRSVAGAALFTQLGIAFYAYMPIVSDLLNPPMNWGYPRTWEGFKHALTRGQYEAIVFQKPTLAQLVGYLKDVRVQFTDLLIPFAIVPFAAGHWIVRKENRRAFWQWMLPVFVCFALMSVLLIALANVKGDLQDGFIQKVKFISSHAMLALWIGYGLVFAACALLFVLVRFTKSSTAKISAYAVAMVMILVAFVYPLIDNYCGNYLLGVNEVAYKLGGSEQNGHTFGWQFGAYQLNGAKAIADQLEEDEEPLPDPSYPPSMEKFSIFFGGTDPGRFVPTYMIYSAKYRPDVYLITQNALADDTYLSVQRDLYGDEIWIPSKLDAADAFSLYVARNNVGGENGRIQVNGTSEVMVINAILTEMMHHHDRDRHDFYVEESFAIPWMYPYLSPHGLILKLNARPTEYDAKIAAKDRDFWDWYTRRLLDDPMYRRDFAAQKSFSKLRTALAGLYHWQGRAEESAQAYREALLLYPPALEPTQKYLWNFLLYEGKFDKAEELIDYAEVLDENSRLVSSARKVLESLRKSERLRTLLARLREFDVKEEVLSDRDALDYIRTLAEVGRMGEASLFAERLLETTKDPLAIKFIEEVFSSSERPHLAEKACLKYLEIRPNDVLAWAALAEYRGEQFDVSGAEEAYRRAEELDRDRLLEHLRRNSNLRAFVQTFLR